MRIVRSVSQETEKTFIQASRGERLRIVLAYLPFGVIVASAFVTLHNLLIGMRLEQAVTQFWIGIFGIGGIGLLFGFIYVFMPSKRELPQTFHWRVIFFSASLGAVATLIIYREVIGPEALSDLLGIGGGTISLDPYRLAALGVWDGLLYGSVVGWLTSTIDEKATRFTRQGVAHYLVLSLLFSGILGLYIWQSTTNDSFGALGILGLLLLVAFIRAGVKLWDQRHTPAE